MAEFSIFLVRVGQIEIITGNGLKNKPLVLQGQWQPDQGREQKNQENTVFNRPLNVLNL